jgi:hypothetical protein
MTQGVTDEAVADEGGAAAPDLAAEYGAASITVLEGLEAVR